MGTRRVLSSRAAIVTLLALFVPTSALADRHTAAVGGGGGRAYRSSLREFGLTGEWVPGGGKGLCPVPLSEKHLCTLSLAGEFNWAQGDHGDGTLTQHVYQLGPRFTYNKLAGWHAQLFVVALPGLTVEKNEQDVTSFSIALGGGADVPLPFFMKETDGTKVPVWVARGQVTWNWIDNHRPDDSYVQWRISLVYRFE